MTIQHVPNAHPLICRAIERNLATAAGRKIRVSNDALRLVIFIADEVKARVCGGDTAKIAELRAVLVEAKAVLDGLEELTA
jgi:ABC-type uncharacterized transport system YnjBCD ATPase subunit